MGKIWQFHEQKKFDRDAVVGRTYYTINEHVITHPGAAKYTYSATTIGKMNHFPYWKWVGGQSARTFCYQSGPVYEDLRDIKRLHPGIRDLAGPTAQVALSDAIPGARQLTPEQMDRIDIRNMSPRELREIEKQLAEMDEANAKKRRRWFSGASR